ncbi:hypothetical protein, partial [Ensifer canadensis]|uniref:hypothetical protein n=1 Tax=Ensifer canadensis TaxID=555315 RepID=UPI0019400AC4
FSQFIEIDKSLRGRIHRLDHFRGGIARSIIGSDARAIDDRLDAERAIDISPASARRRIGSEILRDVAVLRWSSRQPPLGKHGRGPHGKDGDREIHRIIRRRHPHGCNMGDGKRREHEVHHRQERLGWHEGLYEDEGRHQRDVVGEWDTKKLRAAVQKPATVAAE